MERGETFMKHLDDVYRASHQIRHLLFQTSGTVFALSFLYSLLLMVSGSAEAATALSRVPNLSLLQYDLQSLQPKLDDNGILSEVLQQNHVYKSIDYLSKQTNLVLIDTLNGLARKIQITFSPRVVIKPFFLIREVKDILFLIQSRHLKRVQIDQNFQAKTALQPNQIIMLQKLKKSRLFVLSPYQNRLYGLHLNVCW